MEVLSLASDCSGLSAGKGQMLSPQFLILSPYRTTPDEVDVWSKIKVEI
jgi:hypothetical protein